MADLIRKTSSIPVKQIMDLYRDAMRLRAELGWGSTQIALKLGINENIVKCWIYGGTKPSGRLRIPDLTPNLELSYVIGVYYGDGDIRGELGKGWYFRLLVTDFEFIQEFCRCISKVMQREGNPYKASIVHRKNPQASWKTLYQVHVNSRALVEFLRNPSVHKLVVEKFPSAFLKGFYDSDGSISKISPKRNIWKLRVYKTNFELIRYVHGLLEHHFQISPNLRINKSRGPNRKTCYMLETARHDNLRKFCDKIGFTIRRKQEELERAVWRNKHG